MSALRPMGLLYCYCIGLLLIQEFAPQDEELLAYRKGEVYDPEKTKQQSKQKVCLFKVDITLNSPMSTHYNLS